MHNVTAIVLAGGKGTRLRSIIKNRPKCLVEVNNIPFIFYVLDKLIEARVKQIILAINYLGDQVKSVVGHKYKGVAINYSTDSIENGGTGHAVRSAISVVDYPTIFILNGDTYIDMYFSNFLSSTYGNEIGFCINVWRGIANMGMYQAYKDFIYRTIPMHTPYSLEKSFLQDGYINGVKSFVTNAPFIDIGTPESYAKANEFMRSVV